MHLIVSIEVVRRGTVAGGLGSSWRGIHSTCFRYLMLSDARTDVMYSWTFGLFSSMFMWSNQSHSHACRTISSCIQSRLRSCSRLAEVYSFKRRPIWKLHILRLTLATPRDIAYVHRSRFEILFSQAIEETCTQVLINKAPLYTSAGPPVSPPPSHSTQ